MGLFVIKNDLKLVRFLAWYSVAVIAVFYLLPIAGLVIEVQYEALSGVTKFLAVIGLFLVAGVWQVVSMRDRWRNSLPVKSTKPHILPAIEPECARFTGSLQLKWQ